MNDKQPTGVRYIHAFHEAPDLSPDELREMLGGKGASLVAMVNDLALPVPPGFVITSQACRMYMADGWPAGLEDELRAHVERLGARVGRRFGDATDPLLVSVRSGAAVSMPGMMDTILNLGLNESTADGLASVTGDRGFADDCLRRFREGYRQVLGVELAPDDPWFQLRTAIEAVFRSWNSDRAAAFRRHEGIPDELGTAVTVQAMVFGNRGPDSATGVLFTRNPATGKPELYGDLMFNAQGEDVVAGGHEPVPLATLEERLPHLADELRRYADTLERYHADLCDIEFTIERGRLWLLQVRVGKRSARAALRMAIDMAQDPTFPLSREEAVRRVAHHLQNVPRSFVPDGNIPAPLAVGMPASPGIGSGAIVTTSAEAEQAAADGRAVILVRPDTSPEDVPGMAHAAGILTARGGLASHAAVVARGWGIPAVVGASDVIVAEDGVQIGDTRLSAGEIITIDGTSGSVHAGELRGEWRVVPEAATLLEWAAGLGVELSAPVATRPADTDGTDGPPDETVAAATKTDDVLRALLVRGQVAVESLSEGLLADTADVRPLVDELVTAGLAEKAGGAYRLTAEGKLEALAMFDADREVLTEERCVALLEAFPTYDRPLKQIVTAWQVYDVAGEQVFNDHSDLDYDERVLSELAALHEKTVEWLAPLADAMPRLAAYRIRLDRALEEARGGDGRWVASPRVDSYHGVWFELHEDLIRLAGRRRSEEAAAGRA